MSSASKPATCECCGLPNMGGLIDDRLTYCCYACVEEGAAAVDPDGEHYYRRIMSCICGATGVINYDDGKNVGYYCGGSQRCIP